LRDGQEPRGLKVCADSDPQTNPPTNFVLKPTT
jgi:hypothetical protein